MRVENVERKVAQNSEIFRSIVLGIARAIFVEGESSTQCSLFSMPNGRECGAVVGVPLNAHLENDLPAIAARVTARTRAIYIVNPHNPSGTASEAVPFKAFLSEMTKRTTVIVDEAYLEFEPDFAQKTAAELTRSGANVIVFRTFGKIYGLAGMSIGYAVAPKGAAASLKRNGLGAAHSLNRLAVAAAAASRRDPGYVDRMRLNVVEERQKWHTLLDTLGRRRSDSRGNFVFFETGQPHEMIAAQLIREGIEIARAFPPFDLPRRIFYSRSDHSLNDSNFPNFKFDMRQPPQVTSRLCIRRCRCSH